MSGLSLQSFFDSSLAILKENSDFLFKELNKIDGLTCVVPQGETHELNDIYLIYLCNLSI